MQELLFRVVCQFFLFVFVYVKRFSDICIKVSVMMQNTSNRPASETYIWNEGYAYPTEEQRKLTFVCSCIESVALALGIKPSEAYRRMKRVGLIQDYIVACYDTLHTESRANVTADIVETLLYWEARKGGAK